MSAAPFLGLPVRPFVRQKILQRHEKEGAQPAAVPVRQFDLFSFQEAGEETLSEIERVIGAVPLAPDEGVNRTPISATELLEGFGRKGCRGVGQPVRRSSAWWEIRQQSVVAPVLL